MEDFDQLTIMAEKLMDSALAEDLAYGDPTTRAVLSFPARATARIITRDDIVVAGAPFAAMVFNRLDPDAQVRRPLDEGERAKAGTVILEIMSDAGALMAGERVALNILAHLCGIATLTRTYCEKIPAGFRTRIAYTRKTLPGLGILQRYAVLAGGGHAHRPGLGAGILIKDNHIALAGSVKEAVSRALDSAPHPLRIEVEASNEQEVIEALDAGADVLLLDNMSIEQVRHCVELIGKRAVVEVSGGIRVQDIPALAGAGVDIISAGALTHSAPAPDLSLKVVSLD